MFLALLSFHRQDVDLTLTFVSACTLRDYGAALPCPFLMVTSMIRWALCHAPQKIWTGKSHFYGFSHAWHSVLNFSQWWCGLLPGCVALQIKWPALWVSWETSLESLSPLEHRPHQQGYFDCKHLKMSRMDGQLLSNIRNQRILLFKLPMKIEYHRLGDLNNKFLSHKSGDWKSTAKMLAQCLVRFLILTFRWLR